MGIQSSTQPGKRKITAQYTHQTKSCRYPNPYAKRGITQGTVLLIEKVGNQGENKHTAQAGQVKYQALRIEFPAVKHHG